MRPRDTDPAAHEAHIAQHRRLAPARRAELALELSENVREIARAGIRQRHPEYSDDEVGWALRRLIMGDDLFRRAWPAAPLVAP